MNKTIYIILGIIIASFITGIILYPLMPETMASHWGMQGEVNGYMSKFWGLFLMPLLSTGLFILFTYLPRIDPLKNNIDKFRKYYERFITLMIIFLYYIYALTLLWNAGITYNMTIMIIPAFTILFYYMGILIEHAKQNWFIGIRTPWTLSSEHVWNKTHKLGAKLFKISSIIILAGLILPNYAFGILMITVLSATAYITLYSYLEYKKEKRHQRTH